MIPKIIHYCWFGDNSIPVDQKKNIENWKKIMPDYEIRCWNENSIDINNTRFLKEAYEQHKWAFVADYTRVYALYHIGGIYMDTDVVVKKSFNPFLHHSFFTSFEYHPAYSHMKDICRMVDITGKRKTDIDPLEKIPGIGLMSAIIASEPNTSYMRDLINWYDKMTFEENRQNNYTIPTTLAIVAEKYGFRYVNEMQLLESGIAIYPSNIFADYRTADRKSVAIHMCTGSWGSYHGFYGSIHHFLYKYFYRVRFIRRIYLSLRNIFSKYKIYY